VAAPTKRGRGRPPKSEEDKLRYKGVGLTDRQWSEVADLAKELGLKTPSAVRLAIKDLLEKYGRKWVVGGDEDAE